MSIERARQFRDEFAKREALDERAIVNCINCNVRSYTLVNLYQNQKDLLVGSGFVTMTSHACYAKPCEEHAKTHRLYPWMDDVPLEALSAWLDRKEAFAIYALQSLLPKDHPSYDAPAACFAKPVRLSLEHGVTDPTHAHAFVLNDPEAKPA